MKFSKRKTCLAVALAVSALGSAIPAMAATLTGGGSSLVGPSINAEIALFGATPDSLTYYITSSGTGQTAFLNDQASVFGNTTFPVAAGSVAYANSDAGIVAAYLASYNTSYNSTTAPAASHQGPLIQIPYIVTPITIPYVNGPTASTDTLSGPQTTPGQTTSLALNDADLCGVFSGAITNWNKVTNPDTGATYSVNKAINVVYRSDNSGTSELLTRHLAAVCPALTGSTVRADGTTVTFVDSQAFTDSFPSHTPPAGFTGESGSGGIQLALTTARSSASGPSVIGYISPDWTNTFLAPSSSSAAANLSVASVRNKTLNVDVAPTFTEADHAVSSAPLPTPAQQANPLAWVPNTGNPTTGYPVSGTSEILLSTCYADSNAAASLNSFLTDHYTSSNYIATVNNNGFDIPTRYVSLIQNDFLSNTSNLNLNINGSKCTAGVGR